MLLNSFRAFRHEGLSSKFKLRPRLEVKPADTVVLEACYCGTNTSIVGRVTDDAD